MSRPTPYELYEGDLEKNHRSQRDKLRIRIGGYLQKNRNVEPTIKTPSPLSHSLPAA